MRQSGWSHNGFGRTLMAQGAPQIDPALWSKLTLAVLPETIGKR